MKTVFPNREIAHVWANLTREECDAGREGRSNSMRFDGAGFYSYQTCIARIYFGKGGKRALLMDSASYSVTTSAHQGHVRQAWGDADPIWHVRFGKRGQSLRLDGKGIWSAACAEVQSWAEKAAAARSRAPGLLAQAEAAIRTAEEIRQFFGLRNKPYSPDLSKLVEYAKAQDLLNAKLRAKQKKEADAREAKIAELLARLAPRALTLWRANKEDSPEWVTLREEANAGGIHSLAVGPLMRSPEFDGNAALRLSHDGSRVETSQGAQVLTRTVKFLWAFCRQAKATGTPLDSETLARFPRLDNYSANAIDAGGNLTAGCHRIPFAEVEGIARALNLPPFNGAEAEAPTIPQAEEVAS